MTYIEKNRYRLLSPKDIKEIEDKAREKALRDFMSLCDSRCSIESLKGLPIEDIKSMVEQLIDDNKKSLRRAYNED